ncbi:MAG TPA: 23S rRNA (adenine(2503)-C(2))-methyltransferase RlmN [Gemmata sp.]|nr:23S rRNA (adenine(2503)-C(2))-methyltransferase RlmN [Gemmata sp.]
MSSLPMLDPEAKLPQLAERGLSGILPGILDVPVEGLRAWLAERQQPSMRMGQIRRQILANRAISFEEMSDLPKDLRTELAAAYSVFSTRVEKHLIAADQTHKLVLRLHDDQMIECVLIQDEGRATACVSTQVGCGMGCVFCASGLNGVVRNLTSGEIVEQLVRMRNNIGTNTDSNIRTEPKTHFRTPDTALQPRLTHIVVMGMGEPLANLENLLDALTVAGDKNGLGIGARHITISTVGLPAKIRQLAELGKQYHLAVSLHAPNDSLRTRIVPTNDKTGIEAILESAFYFFEKTGRQVTYEYVVLGGVNDRVDHAKELARLLVGRKSHVNLIPWNDVEGLQYRRPKDEDLTRFMEILHRSGVSVKVRKRKGSEIDAACGQLRRKVEQETAH